MNIFHTLLFPFLGVFALIFPSISATAGTAIPINSNVFDARFAQNGGSVSTPNPLNSVTLGDTDRYWLEFDTSSIPITSIDSFTESQLNWSAKAPADQDFQICGYMFPKDPNSPHWYDNLYSPFSDPPDPTHYTSLGCTNIFSGVLQIDHTQAMTMIKNGGFVLLADQSSGKTVPVVGMSLYVNYRPNPNPSPTPIPLSITGVSPAKVWIGQDENSRSDAKLDLLAQEYVDGNLFATGELDNISPGGPRFSGAKSYSIPFSSIQPTTYNTGSTIKTVLSVRNSCTDGRNNIDTARLWFNDSEADSQFGITTNGNDTTEYIIHNFATSLKPGPGPKEKIDVELEEDQRTWQDRWSKWRNFRGNDVKGISNDLRDNRDNNDASRSARRWDRTDPSCGPFKPFGSWNIIL